LARPDEQPPQSKNAAFSDFLYACSIGRFPAQRQLEIMTARGALSKPSTSWRSGSGQGLILCIFHLCNTKVKLANTTFGHAKHVVLVLDFGGLFLVSTTGTTFDDQRYGSVVY
jgi:hypothetical protein